MFIVSANHIIATLRILITRVISWYIVDITNSDIVVFYCTYIHENWGARWRSG
jgi:hypothetical protein